MDKAWAGVDVGKGFHWAHVLDVSGRELLSRRVENDEADILRLIDEALLHRGGSLGSRSTWRWCGALASAAMGTRSESPLRPWPQRG
jgi:Transposase